MRPRYKHPYNKRYFHTKPRIDNRDMAILKRKIEDIKHKNNKRELEE